jgi:hypothetical protein
MNRGVLILILTLMCVNGCHKSDNEPGYLAGIISIGPLCPVERIPPDPSCLPTAETYKAYPVSVYTSDGEKKMSLLNPLLDGSFTCDLPPGKYKVVLDKPQNFIGSSNLPVGISIVSMDTTKLNITIDTGIR